MKPDQNFTTLTIQRLLSLLEPLQAKLAPLLEYDGWFVVPEFLPRISRRLYVSEEQLVVITAYLCKLGLSPDAARLRCDWRVLNEWAFTPTYDVLMDGHSRSPTSPTRVSVTADRLSRQLAELILELQPGPTDKTVEGTNGVPQVGEAPAEAEWEATAIGLFVTTEPKPTITQLHKKLVAQGYKGTRQNLYNMPGLVALAKELGTYKPKAGKGQYRVRGSKSRGGEMEAWTDEETA